MYTRSDMCFFPAKLSSRAGTCFFFPAKLCSRAANWEENRLLFHFISVSSYLIAVSSYFTSKSWLKNSNLLLLFIKTWLKNSNLFFFSRLSYGRIQDFYCFFAEQRLRLVHSVFLWAKLGKECLIHCVFLALLMNYLCGFGICCYIRIKNSLSLMKNIYDSANI